MCRLFSSFLYFLFFLQSLNFRCICRFLLFFSSLLCECVAILPSFLKVFYSNIMISSLSSDSVSLDIVPSVVFCFFFFFTCASPAIKISVDFVVKFSSIQCVVCFNFSFLDFLFLFLFNVSIYFILVCAFVFQFHSLFFVFRALNCFACPFFFLFVIQHIIFVFVFVPRPITTERFLQHSVYHVWCHTILYVLLLFFNTSIFLLLLKFFIYLFFFLLFWFNTYV